VPPRTGATLINQKQNADASKTQFADTSETQLADTSKKMNGDCVADKNN